MNPELAAPAMTPFLTPIVNVRTRQQLDVLLENIAALQRERTDLLTAQEKEIAAVRQRYRARLNEAETFLHAETTWAESWAQAHPEAFATGRQLIAEHATLGYRAAAPRIDRASRRWTWTRIAQALAALTWGQRYLRIPAPEVDKDALAADLEKLSLTELRAVGIIVTHGETFFIEPHDAPPAIAWSEAA